MRYFSLHQEKPLSFIVCGMLSSKNNFIHIKRQFSENVFILIKKGTLFITSNSKQYELTSNQFIFLRANELHFGTKTSEEELEYYWVHFSDSFDITTEPKSTQENEYFLPETGKINNSNKVALLFNQLLDFYITDKQNQKLLDYSLSLLFLELTSELKATKDSDDFPPVLYNSIAWIKANYSKNFSIRELSDFANCSSSNLSNLFKTYMNMSIIQYTNKIRIESAKNLLSYFDYNIKKCAYECGFDDEKYFMKVFKTQEGITPTEYKNTFYKKNIN